MMVLIEKVLTNFAALFTDKFIIAYYIKNNNLTTGKYLGVMALDSPYIGYVVRETEDKIVVFGEANERYDIPKSEIQTMEEMY